MAEEIKSIYNRESLRKVASDIHSVYGSFQIEEFLNSTMNETWDTLRLKDRIYQISTMLGNYLPADYGEAIGVIDKVVMNYGTWLEGFCGFFPIFVEVYGQDEANWDTSIAALARYTPYASSEIAVRSFIINHEERMLAQLYEWSKDEDECVRRLSCEGCRPALPWGQALTSFKKDPTPILPILTQLKNDPSLHVRKSVANNLNDISKTHPDLVASIANEWYDENEYTNWIVKHGCRTLLKQGNRDVLAIFGYHDVTSIDVSDFILGATIVPIGGTMSFSFSIYAKEETKVRLEYAIDYVKANGKRNRKIFQISESSLKKNVKKAYDKKHSFANLSTRKHYPGIHSIALIINGVERESLDFELIIK